MMVFRMAMKRRSVVQMLTVMVSMIPTTLMLPAVPMLMVMA